MQPRWKKAAARTLVVVVFALVLARTVRQLERSPSLNWDMLPAMALALEWEEHDPAQVHGRTYAHAREELGPEVFAELTSPGVRLARYQDPEAFHEHLPFYRARVLYTLGIYVLQVLGAPLTAATWWIPLGAFVLGAVLFLVWSTRYLGYPLAAVFALGLAHTPALLHLATFSTADGLATLLVCAGGYVLVERRSFAAGAALLGLSIAARPDAVLLVGFLAPCLFLILPRQERPSARALGAWVAASALLVLALQRFAGEYGWWPLITISFDEKVVHPAELPTAVDWGHYREILARQVGALPGDGYVRTPREVTGSTLVFTYAALALLGLALGWRERARLGRHIALLAALLAASAVHFLLFPQIWDRFFAPFYALVPLCLLAMVVSGVRRSAERVG